MKVGRSSIFCTTSLGAIGLIFLSALPCSCQEKTAATKPAPIQAEASRQGMTCAQILAMSASDWVARFKEKDAAPQATIRGVAAYGKCYDARTDRLAAHLARSGKGPPIGARRNFHDFETALSAFAAQALTATDPPANAEKTAYAALYEKQFRYEFYRSHERKSAKPGVASAEKKGTTGKSGASSAESGAGDTQQPAQTPEASPSEVTEMTKAKNRFGELLGLLPQDKMHDLHKSFGRIFSGGPVSEETKLAVYRYAIFLLEAPSAAPFSPPPF